MLLTKRMLTYHCEGIPTILALLKSSINSWLIFGLLPMLSISLVYNPGVFLHALNNNLAAVRLNVRYPRATATALRTCSFGECSLFMRTSMAPVVTIASGMPARVWARLDNRLLARTTTLSSSELSLLTSRVTPSAVSDTWSWSMMTLASTTIYKIHHFKT